MNSLELFVNAFELFMNPLKLLINCGKISVGLSGPVTDSRKSLINTRKLGCRLGEAFKHFTAQPELVGTQAFNIRFRGEILRTFGQYREVCFYLVRIQLKPLDAFSQSLHRVSS